MVYMRRERFSGASGVGGRMFQEQEGSAQKTWRSSGASRLSLLSRRFPIRI